MDIQALQAKAESDLLWQMAMARHFKLIELETCYGLVRATQTKGAEQKKKKRLVLEEIIKEIRSLQEVM